MPKDAPCLIRRPFGATIGAAPTCLLRKGLLTDSRDVWTPEDPARMAASLRNVLVVAFLVGVGFVIAVLGSFSVPVGKGVSSFWPAMTIQCLGGIWFGGWGVIAGTVFFFVEPKRRTEKQAASNWPSLMVGAGGAFIEGRF